MPMRRFCKRVAAVGWQVGVYPGRLSAQHGAEFGAGHGSPAVGVAGDEERGELELTAESETLIDAGDHEGSGPGIGEHAVLVDDTDGFGGIDKGSAGARIQGVSVAGSGVLEVLAISAGGGDGGAAEGNFGTERAAWGRFNGDPPGLTSGLDASAAEFTADFEEITGGADQFESAGDVVDGEAFGDGGEIELQRAGLEDESPGVVEADVTPAVGGRGTFGRGLAALAGDRSPSGRRPRRERVEGRGEAGDIEGGLEDMKELGGPDPMTAGARL